MAHRFHFFRAGGVDQVSLRDGADMLALGELDQKLWVALAMPSSGISIDSDTLKLLDADGDGRIRVQDILAAVAWAEATFADPGELLTSRDEVALAALSDPMVVSAAKRMLSDLGKAKETTITVADTLAVEKAFADTVRNGDGIVIPASAGSDDELRKVIEDAIACTGSVTDRSGKPGIDEAHAAAFFADVDARAAWLASGDQARGVPGDTTAAAHDAFAAVRDKITDYFTRCRIAAFDARGIAALSGQEPALISLGERVLSETDPELAKLPIAHVDAAARLPLRGAVNPAWASRLEAFATATVAPLLGARDHLTPADLAAIADKLAPYDAWLRSKPATKVDALDPAWIAKLAGPDLRKRVAELIASDAALADEYAKIGAVSKAVRMQRDFARILRNFVNFSDFYSRQDGVFQAGTLYLDARALHLCIPVTDAAKHGALAAASDTCLLYCDVTRKGETKQIAAALTNGDIDNVFVGRNGIFYDREGRDWDAVITKVINNPISVRAAFWAPYKKLVKTIEDTVAKRAQAADARSSAVMESAGTEVGNADKEALADVGAAEAPPPAAPAAKPAKIDLGTVAAIGVAIGGLGTLIGALLANLFGLGRWLPLGIVALLLMISGPSMLLAWLKLRRRNLGPILDANGWAINGRTRINVPFGAAMTELPKLPVGSKRSLDDPFAEKRTPWKLYAFAVAALGLSGAWYLGKLDRYLPKYATSTAVLGDNAPAAKSKTAAPAPAPSPAPPSPSK